MGRICLIEESTILDKGNPVPDEIGQDSEEMLGKITDLFPLCSVENSWTITPSHIPIHSFMEMQTITGTVQQHYGRQKLGS